MFKTKHVFPPTGHLLGAHDFPGGFDGLQNHINSNAGFIHLFYRTAEMIPPFIPHPWEMRSNLIAMLYITVTNHFGSVFVQQ